MANLSTRTKRINLIISLNGFNEISTKDLIVKLLAWCQNNTSLYAFILHDRDINEQGEPKTPHIHLTMEIPHAKRLSTILKDVASFTLVNPLAVSIDKCSNLDASIQYLIHKNNPEKYQYSKDDIACNFADEIDTYMESSNNVGFDIDLWIKVCSESDGLIDVIKGIGITYYNLYRNTIRDIYFSIKGKEF